MDRNPILLFAISCFLVVGASGIVKAKGPIAQASPSPVRQPAVPGENEGAKGSISGRVVNENGEPVAGLVVFVGYGRRGARPYMDLNTDVVETNKDGHFHVSDLLPGEYVLSVERPCCEQTDLNQSDRTDEAPYYKTEVTYYKDTPDRKDAVPVLVKPNMETTGIKITLRRRPLHKVSGTVFSREGQPVAGARLSMIRKQKPDTAPHSAGVSTVANSQGEWSFEVPDGVYIINALKINTVVEGGGNVSGSQAPSTTGLPMPLVLVPSVIGRQSSATNLAQSLQVGVSDVPNVSIEMKGRAQIVSGKVMLEDGSPLPSEATVNLSLDGFWDSKVVAADGSFLLKGPMLGEKFLSVFIQPFGTYYVKSITCDGTDYLRDAFEFGNGLDYKGVDIVLAPGGAVLDGDVRTFRTNSRVTNGQVWLIPKDETKWRAPLTWFVSPISEDGTFTVYAAPGDYWIIVDQGKELTLDPYDLDRAEDYIRERTPGGPRISLKPGERNSVRLYVR